MLLFSTKSSQLGTYMNQSSKPLSYELKRRSFLSNANIGRDRIPYWNLHSFAIFIAGSCESLHSQPRSHSDIKCTQELLIWGHDHHVKQAKSALSDLFRRSRNITPGAPGSRLMPSIRPISERNQKFYEYKLQEEAQKQKFSQAPEEGMNFLVTVSNEILYLDLTRRVF